jgi:hypothetical protein
VNPIEIFYDGCSRSGEVRKNAFSGRIARRRVSLDLTDSPMGSERTMVENAMVV